MCSRVLHTPLRYLDIGFPFNCPWKEQSIKSLSEQSFEWGNPRFPIDTGRKLNVHKIFKRWPGRLLNVLCTLHLRPVSTGLIYVKWQKKKYQTCSLIESPELKKNWEMQLQMSPEIYWLQPKTVIGRESGLSHHDIWAINTKNIPKPWWEFQYLVSLIWLAYRIEIAIVKFIQVKSLFHWVKSTVYGFF